MESVLPLINTSLIVVSGVALIFGWLFIRRNQIEYHKWSMIIATGFASLFLVVYVTRYLLYGSHLFAGEGFWRGIYLTILATHVVLATAIIPLVLIVLYRAYMRQFPRHRSIARVTLPMWIYVVVTGWVIYMMLYQINFASV